jgi:hypothetical protein
VATGRFNGLRSLGFLLNFNPGGRCWPAIADYRLEGIIQRLVAFTNP